MPPRTRDLLEDIEPVNLAQWPAESVSIKGFGARIESVYQRSGLTLEEFSRSIGKGKSTVARYFNETNTPDAVTLERIANNYGVDPGWVAFGVPHKIDLSEALKSFTNDERQAIARFLKIMSASD